MVAKLGSSRDQARQHEDARYQSRNVSSLPRLLLGPLSTTVPPERASPKPDAAPANLAYIGIGIVGPRSHGRRRDGPSLAGATTKWSLTVAGPGRGGGFRRSIGQALEDLVSKLEPPARRRSWFHRDPTEEAIEEMLEPAQCQRHRYRRRNSRYTDGVRALGNPERGRESRSSTPAPPAAHLGSDRGLLPHGRRRTEAAFDRIWPDLAERHSLRRWLRAGGTTGRRALREDGPQRRRVHAASRAYGEGLEFMAAGRFELDLRRSPELWRHGSVVRSWLFDLLGERPRQGPRFDAGRGYVGKTRGRVDGQSMKRWRTRSPAPTITLSLFARFASRQDDSFSAKVIAALRKEFIAAGPRAPETAEDRVRTKWPPIGSRRRLDGPGRRSPTVPGS